MLSLTSTVKIYMMPRDRDAWLTANTHEIGLACLAADEPHCGQTFLTD